MMNQSDLKRYFVAYTPIKHVKNETFRFGLLHEFSIQKDAAGIIKVDGVIMKDFLTSISVK